MRRTRQLALELGRHTVSRNRGGRPVGTNPRVLHRSRKPFRATEPCHVTLKVRPGMPSLRDGAIVRALEEAFRRGNERKEFRLVHYSLPADHAHLSGEAKHREALGRGMKSLASRFARAVNRALGRRGGKVLADRYHLEVLTCPRKVRNALAYVLLNVRRHAAKRIVKLRRMGLNVPSLANTGALDPASSARWFKGWLGGAGRDARPRGRPPVAEATTWLLTTAWKRYGLIDPNEIPGRVSM